MMTPSTTSPVFEYNHNEEKAKDMEKLKEEVKEEEEEQALSFTSSFSSSCPTPHPGTMHTYPTTCTPTP